MPSEAELLQIEVALRDSRHTEVIMALDRLVLLPGTKREMQQAMGDLTTVKDFIDHHLPKSYLGAAREVFVEHGKLMKQYFIDAQHGLGK